MEDYLFLWIVQCFGEHFVFKANYEQVSHHFEVLFQDLGQALLMQSVQIEETIVQDWWGQMDHIQTVLCRHLHVVCHGKHAHPV